jgi:hypothetical protein
MVVAKGELKWIEVRFGDESELLETEESASIILKEQSKDQRTYGH